MILSKKVARYSKMYIDTTEYLDKLMLKLENDQISVQ